MVSKSFRLVINDKISSFNKTIRVDSDKSLSIRSFLIGSISQNISLVKNVLESEDVKSTILSCKKLGVKIKKVKSNSYKIYGKGLGSLSIKKGSELNFSNSGTLARLLIGILSTTPNIDIRVVGDHSLNKRNMKKLIDLTSKFGATFFPKNKTTFPLKMTSSLFPIGIKYNAGVSAQLKSAAILAGLNSYGDTIINEKTISRDHTENLLMNNSQVIKIKKGKKKVIRVHGKKYLKPFFTSISGDPSSAAFFVALTLLNPNSSLKIRDVGLNPTRIGFYKILKKHNAKIKFLNVKKKNHEIRGDIVVKSSNIKPIKSLANMYPSTTDEYLLLFCIAGLTKGKSSFKGISDLSNKESSRAHEMKKILYQLGIKCKLTKDEMKISGKTLENITKRKIAVGNLGDHRIAMCAFILGILTKSKTNIKNFETVFTSSPSFLNIMKSLGAKFEIKKK
jgi:3-phosphoshikimate 1-carboxyvinyltransferase